MTLCSFLPRDLSADVVVVAGTTFVRSEMPAVIALLVIDLASEGDSACLVAPITEAAEVAEAAVPSEAAEETMPGEGIVPGAAVDSVEAITARRVRSQRPVCSCACGVDAPAATALSLRSPSWMSARVTGRGYGAASFGGSTSRPCSSLSLWRRGSLIERKALVVLRRGKLGSGHGGEKEGQTKVGQ